MAEDFELAAAITVEDESELQDLTADVGAEGDDGGQAGIVGAGGGDGDRGGGILGKRLTAIVSLLSRVLAAVGVITLIPGLLDGVFRLLEIALLPIGVLFQNLLAPLIQRLLRFFASTNLFDKIGRFADIIVQSVQGLVNDIQPLINDIANLTGTLADQAGFEQDQELNTTEAAALSSVRGAGNVLPGGFAASLLSQEFTAQSFDDLSSDATNQTNKEDGN
jgi:hypothetical protein